MELLVAITTTGGVLLVLSTVHDCELPLLLVEVHVLVVAAGIPHLHGTLRNAWVGPHNWAEMRPALPKL
jgi:hypothetical protein